MSQFPSTTPSVQSLRLLVVEDCRASAFLASALIKKIGAECDLAASGADAIDLVRAKEFDAVLMDCGLPDMDGLEVTRRIRSGACGATKIDIPILAFAANYDDEMRARCAAAGMVGTISKPIMLAELRSTLSALAMQRSHRTDHAAPANGAASGPSAEDSAPPRSSTVTSGFDAALLLERVAADSDLATEVLASFIADLPGQISEIVRAVESASCDQTARLAHRLRGAAGSVGATRLLELTRELEAAGKANDLSALRRLAPELDEASRAVVSEIEATDLVARSRAARSVLTPAEPGSRSSVLLVEDDPTIRTMLSGMLEKAGYSVTSVESGSAARAAFETAPPGTIDCMVTDYMMPGENGLELIIHVRRRDPSIAAILMTADENRKVVTDALRAGVFDFIEKPVSAKRLCGAVTGGVVKAREQRKLVRVRKEVAAMGRMQEQMLRSQRSCSRPVELCFFPKLDAGGDFFSQFALKDGRTIYLLTDVSGHDLQAAYLSAYFHGVTRGMLDRMGTAREVFEFFNRFLVEEWNAAVGSTESGGQSLASVALSSVVIDESQGTIESLTCGAPAPCRATDDGRISVVGERGGSPLGWFGDLVAQSTTMPLEGGGEIILWSDGLDEVAQSAGASVLSAAYVVREARRTGVPHPLIEHAGDDILLVAISTDGERSATSRFQPLVMWRYRGNQSEQIDEMVAYWRRSLRLALPNLAETVEHDVLLATREAMLNAMEHGCQGQESGVAKLQMSYCPDQRLLRVWVEDTGSGHSFDCAAHAGFAPDGLVTAHRGLMFIHFLAAEVRSERNGASLRMDFRI